MTDGVVQLWGGKLLRSGGKISTADECCCDGPPPDYGCCEGVLGCDSCNEDTGPDTWRADWTGNAPGEYDLGGCIECTLLQSWCSDLCAWAYTSGSSFYIHLCIAGSGPDVLYQLEMYQDLVECGSYILRYVSVVFDPLGIDSYDGNCLHWIDPGTGKMTLSHYQTLDYTSCGSFTVPDTVEVWPV